MPEKPEGGGRFGTAPSGGGSSGSSGGGSSAGGAVKPAAPAPAAEPETDYRSGTSSKISIKGCSYSVKGSSCTIKADRVQNDSPWRTGKLYLALWFAKEPYNGGTINGTCMAKTNWKDPLKQGFWYPNVNNNCTVTGSVAPGKYYAVITVNEKHESGSNYIVGWTNFTTPFWWKMADPAAPVESRKGEASRISIGGAEFAWQEDAGGDSFSFSLALKDVRNNSSWGSGKLNLDLWYCKEPYKGGSIDGFRLFTGMPVSFSEGGRTGIQAGTSKSRAGFSATLPFASAPPSGTYSVLFVLTEDNADGTKKQAGYYNYEWQTDWREQAPEGQQSELSLDDFSYELKAGRLTVTPKVTNASAWESRPLTLEFYLCKQQGYAGGTNPDKWPALNPSDAASVAKWDEAECVFEADGFRLPEESEFLYACAGGAANETNLYPGSGNLGEVAWCEFNSGGSVHDVATKKPNSLGLYDLNGNVQQWVWDRGDGDTPGKPERLAYGGSYKLASWQNFGRASLSASLAADDTGLRLCRSV